MLSKFVKESRLLIDKKDVRHVVSIIRARINLRNMLKSLNFNIFLYVD